MSWIKGEIVSYTDDGKPVYRWYSRDMQQTRDQHIMPGTAPAAQPKPAPSPRPAAPPPSSPPSPPSPRPQPAAAAPQASQTQPREVTFEHMKQQLDQLAKAHGNKTWGVILNHWDKLRSQGKDQAIPSAATANQIYEYLHPQTPTAKTPTPPPSPPPATGKPPGQKTEAEQWKEQEQGMANRFLDQELNKANLRPEVKEKYRATTQKILGKMSARSLSRWNKNVKDIKFFGDTKGMTDFYVQNSQNAETIDLLKSGGAELRGVYVGSRDNPFLALNGGEETDPGSIAATEGTYAHEFTHAIDGPSSHISSSDEWREAYNKEIKGRGVSKYAWTNESEGLAEFGRLLFTSADPASLWAAYPLSMKVTQMWGLHDHADPNAR